MSNLHPIFDDILRGFMAPQAVRAFDPFAPDLIPFHIRAQREDGTTVEQVIHAPNACTAVQQAISEGLCSIVCKPVAKK